jgi:hypothetical protein
MLAKHKNLFAKNIHAANHKQKDKIKPTEHTIIVKDIVSFRIKKTPSNAFGIIRRFNN